MTKRVEIVRDLANHLGDDLARTVQRHARLAEAGGVSVIELAAIMMIAAEGVAVQSIGTVLIAADERRRADLFDETVPQLARAVTKRRTFILAHIDAAERVAGLAEYRS